MAIENSHVQSKKVKQRRKFNPWTTEFYKQHQIQIILLWFLESDVVCISLIIISKKIFSTFGFKNLNLIFSIILPNYFCVGL
jgi:hypothetical protein